MHENPFPFGCGLGFLSLQVFLHIAVYLPDQLLQLPVKHGIPPGKPVGLFRKQPVLQVLFRYHMAVERVEHGGGGCGRIVLFLTEQTQKSLAFRLAGGFVRTLPCYGGHSVGYLPVEGLLPEIQCGKIIQLRFLVCQYPAQAVYSFLFGTEHVAERTQRAVDNHPLQVVFFLVAVRPFHDGFSEK